MRRFLLLVVLLVALVLVVSTVVSAFGLVDREELLATSGLELDVTTLDAGWTSATGTGQPPRLGPNVQANDPQLSLPDGLLGRSETSIAVANDKRKMVAGWNDADGFCGPPFGAPCTAPPVPGLSGFAYSGDGGLTWTDGGAPYVYDNAITRGDPWLDTDGSTFYYANLAVNADDAGARGVIVHRGGFTDDIFAWTGAAIFDSPRNAETPDADFYDKEALASAKDGSGAVYVSVTNFQEMCGQAQWGFGQIEVWRSHDFGVTWQGPAIAGPEAADSVASCASEGTLQQSSVPAVGPNGEVYVVWQYGPTFADNGEVSTDADIVIARSGDGGATFEEPVKVADIYSMRQNPPVAYNRSRINDHPRVAVATSGPQRGRVYVTFYSSAAPVGPAADPTVQSLVSSQVYVSYSDDQGATWSEPVAVAAEVPAEGVKRFWPVVTVQPNGNVDVVYYESLETQATEDPSDIECRISIGGGLFRTGLASSLVDTYWVQSTDGGQSFGEPIRVSTETTNWCQVASNIRPNMGDYIGSAGGANRVIPAWADGRSGAPDTFVANGLSAGKSR